MTYRKEGEFLIGMGKSKNGKFKLYYMVKPSDTLWGISKKFGVSIKQLKQLNDLSSDLIFVGQVLKVKDIFEDEQYLSETSEKKKP